MQYANLGAAGLKVSRICLGCMTYGSSAWRDWVLDDAAARPFIARALELNINFFDTADVYSSGESETFRPAAPRLAYCIKTPVGPSVDCYGCGMSPSTLPTSGR